MNFHDRDLSISLDGLLHVHCEYEVTDVTVLMSNRGLEDYSGIVNLTVTSVRAGFRETVGSRQFGSVLNPGEEQVVGAGCRGIPHGNSILEIRIEAEGDTNRSNDSVSLLTSSSPGDVVISEIMYRPAGGGEWIELFNRSPGSVDLSGWTVTDRSGASGSISDGVEIGAGGYIILAQDPRGMASEFPACRGDVTSLENGWPRLNDGDGHGTAEEIFVRSRDGIMAESVSYRSMIIDEKGRSIERLSPELCSAGRDGIWLRCGSSAGATPGERNYCHTGSIPSSGMSVSPDPFCPEIDGTVRFSAAAAAGETSYGASLFDMEGREVARLASGPVGAPAVSFCWDGRDEEGRPAMTGLYICVVEFKCGGGGVCRREKGIVRVWAGQR